MQGGRMTGKKRPTPLVAVVLLGALQTMGCAKKEAAPVKVAPGAQVDKDQQQAVQTEQGGAAPSNPR